MTTGMLWVICGSFYGMGWIGASLAFEQNRGSKERTWLDGAFWPWFVVLCLVRKAILK